jgi:hypothetical protein
MSKYLGRRATLLGWFDEAKSDPQAPNPAWSSTCIAIKLPDNSYTFSPTSVSPALTDAVHRLNENAVVSISSRITASVLDSLAPEQKSFVVEYTGTRIPILASLDEVQSGISHFSRACIVRRERVLLVWCHEPSTILDVVFDVEMQLSGKESKLSNLTTPRISGHSTPLSAGAALVILGRSTPDSKTASASPSAAGLVRGALDEKHDLYSRAVALEERGDEDEEPDLEKALAPRPLVRVHAVKITFAIMLVIITQALGVARVGLLPDCLFSFLSFFFFFFFSLCFSLVWFVVTF